MSQLLELDPILVKPLRSEVPFLKERETPTAPLDPLLVSPLRRPEPQKAPRRRRASGTSVRPAVLRAAAILVGATAFFCFAGRITAFAVEPVLATHQTGREIQILQQQLTLERSINRQLQNDIAYLGTPAGIEMEARRRGWVKEGEVALSPITPETAAPATPAPVSEQVVAADASGSVSARIRQSVDTIMAVLGSRPRSQ